MSMELVKPKRPYRFHILGYTHLPVSERYMACAFTQKIVKLNKMLLSMGHEVFLYGAEGSDAPCTEFIQTHTLADIRREWGDGDNRPECDGLGYQWRKTGFRHDFNDKPTHTTIKFRTNAAKAINERKRPDDFLLLMQGHYHKQVADEVKLYLTCEPGIGYRGAIKTPLPYSQGPFHAFESTYLRDFVSGSWFPMKSINGSYYDRVIPNYFDANDFPFQEKKEDYFFYIGRMIQRKGVWTAINTAGAVGKKLILAGQESDEVNVNNLPPHCEFVGYVEPAERAELMGKAIATFTPTIYLEAFAGTHVESMLCGTPVITTNFGVFNDTIINGVNGYRCDTMQDFVNAARVIKQLTPAIVRHYAEQYLMKNVRFEFQKWWDDLYQLYLSATDPAWKGKGWSYYE